MVEHMVWFKLKETATEQDKVAMIAGANALAGKIDGVVSVASGRDFSGRSRGYEIGLSVRFTTREALELYGPHPEHQKFVQTFKPLWEDVTALDFEV